MRILFVRHGHPNYEKDCLTELGHQQAAKAAERLASEPIKAFYSSTCGRAVETAAHTAERFGLPVTSYDFIRELRWSYDDLPIKGNPWELFWALRGRGEVSIFGEAWREHPCFAKNLFQQSAASVAEQTDVWLESLGYRREGELYRCVKRCDDTIAMFSHAGSSSAAMAHILNLSLPFVFSEWELDFTSISAIRLNGEAGELVIPRLDCLNDHRHILDLLS